MKSSIFIINFVATLMIENAVTSAQDTTPPLTMGDFILRSCIASAVFVRNHRNSQLPSTNVGGDYSMIPNDNVIKKKRLSANNNMQITSQDTTWREREKVGVDTPLKTIDIKRGRMTDLIFMKKDYFPEISLSHFYDDRKDKNSKIIVIKSADRG